MLFRGCLPVTRRQVGPDGAPAARMPGPCRRPTPLCRRPSSIDPRESFSRFPITNRPIFRTAALPASRICCRAGYRHSSLRCRQCPLRLHGVLPSPRGGRLERSRLGRQRGARTRCAVCPRTRYVCAQGSGVKEVRVPPGLYLGLHLAKPYRSDGLQFACSSAVPVSRHPHADGAIATAEISGRAT